MLTIEEIRKRLRDQRPADVAEKTGLHENTVRKFLLPGNNPTYKTIKKLSIYLEGKNG